MTSPNANQPALFPQSFAAQSDSLSSRTPASNVPRQRQIDRAFAKGDPVVMARYRDVLTAIAKELGTFGAWNVTAAYTKRFGKLNETDRKAIGGLWQGMIHRGELIEVGTDKRPNGNKASVYRLI